MTAAELKAQHLTDMVRKVDRFATVGHANDGTWFLTTAAGRKEVFVTLAMNEHDAIVALNRRYSLAVSPGSAWKE